jgi:hypothetical protein
MKNGKFHVGPATDARQGKSQAAPLMKRTSEAHLTVAQLHEADAADAG